jgi:serine/threonine-protein kinase
MDRGTRDQEAYDLYLRGRYLWQRRGESSLRQASMLFAQAIAKDSTFARAWAGLAMVQVVLPEFIAVPDDTLIDAGIRSARRAVALNRNVAEGHLALGYGLLNRWDWEGSEAEFNRGLSLEPDNASMHQWYGDLLIAMGRMPEAVHQLDMAQQRDPTAAIIALDLSYALLSQQRWSDAIAMGRRGLELDASLSGAYPNLAQMYTLKGNADTALAVLAQQTRFGAPLPQHQAYKIMALFQAGRTAEAREAVNAFDEQARRGVVGWYFSGMAHAFMGDTAVALSALTRAVDLHQADLVLGLVCDPAFAKIRDDARFQALLTRLKLGACVLR